MDRFFEWDDENQVNVPIGKEIDRDAKTGEEYYLDGWQPEKPGYRFVGWAYEQDATEEDIIENPLIFELGPPEFSADHKINRTRLV